jgi:hypothetical protein
MRHFLPLFLLAVAGLQLGSAPTNTVLGLNELAWFYGRSYFVLRSGPAQMIVQSDRADLGPALTYLLFDARDGRQSRLKSGALNWDKQTGVSHAALEVVLGGFLFTALGHRTEARWDVSEDGIPGVKTTWWAGGLRVSEFISARDEEGVFTRVVDVEGAHLAGAEEVSLRLRLPGPNLQAAGDVLIAALPHAMLAIGVPGPLHSRVDVAAGSVVIGPLTVQPGSKVRVNTALAVELAPGHPEAAAAQLRARLNTSGSTIAASTGDKWRAGSRILTRDQVVQGVYDRARFQLAGMVADDGTMNAGIFEYGAQWVRDTSNTALGMLHAGQFEATRAALVRMLTKMVSPDGVTMIANAFEKPDLEQFDQMGELLHLLKAYRDWSGDDSLIREHRELLLALVERPLRPEFRDATGMVHNRREFWERTFTDAYELAYQTYVILGLRDAADLAESLGTADRAPRWRAEADRMLQAVLRHPQMALVDNGHLIKRRKVTGEIADDPAGFKGFSPDVPLNTERVHRLMPDASMALPLALGVIDPQSSLGRGTLDFLEQLWNTRWSDGGYDRYHTSGQPDQPGPWPFATTFILRAQHDAGLLERSRRSLEWLNGSAGGETGAWFEEISSVRSQMRACGLVPWTSGEVTLFAVRHYLGVRFEGQNLVIRPQLFPGGPPVTADLRFRQGRLQLDITGEGDVKRVTYNGKSLKISRGRVTLSPAGS